MADELADETNHSEARQRGSRLRHHWWQRRWFHALAMVVVVAAVAIALGMLYLQRHAAPILRARLVQTLSSSFNTNVQLDHFSVSFLNGIEVQGGGLRIPFGDRTQLASPEQPASPRQKVLPLLSIDHFTFRTNIWGLLRQPTHVAMLKVEGMQLHIPPAGERGALFNGRGANHHDPHAKISLAISEVRASNVKLFIESGKPGKQPLEFDIDKLDLTHIGPSESSTYAARLVNPKPRGVIQARGHFGPWNSENPRQTPISGDYTFSNADMNTIKGIGGTLQGQGHYDGVLDHLMVDGTADVPNFSLDTANHPMRLDTSYHALVDGSNGDTYLDPVRAVLGKSSFTCQGKVVKVGDAGHDIELSVDMPDGRIEDMLQLAMKTDPPVMRGAVAMQAKLRIPPGPERVTEKMRLAGKLVIQGVEFGNPEVQDKVDGLSMRAQGKPKDVKAAETDRKPEVASRMAVDFALAHGTMTVSALRYKLPGATVLLDGAYSMDGNVFEFKGHVRTAAKASQMVTGWKSWLLKPIDPFLEKHGAGLELPIAIHGTGGDVNFGLAMHDASESPAAMKTDLNQLRTETRTNAEARRLNAEAKRLNDKADREDVEAAQEKDLAKAEAIHNQALRDRARARRLTTAGAAPQP